jgi:hypothetical protein
MEVNMLTNNFSFSGDPLRSHFPRADQNSISSLARQHSAGAAGSNISLINISATYSANDIAVGDKQKDAITSRWFKMDRLVSACESDPAYAKQVAEELAFAKDGMILDWADAPSPADTDAWNAWVNQTDDFAKAAEPINAQRLDLYNKLKAQGTPDIDIVQSILKFNGSQSTEYQIKTGFMSLDITA